MGRIKRNKNKIRMFKTTLIAAIALAGAQAIKINSQATSETSAGALSSDLGMLAQTSEKPMLGEEDEKLANGWGLVDEQGGGLAQTGSASGSNPCLMPDFSEAGATGILSEGGFNTRDFANLCY